MCLGEQNDEGSAVKLPLTMSSTLIHVDSGIGALTCPIHLARR